VAGFSFVLVADDYAISPAVSRGIREALAAGRLSGAGAMTNRPNWPEAARELQAAGFAAKAGLHLNLTCGEPLTGMPSLAADGRLPQLGPVLKGSRKRSLPPGEIAAELAAQIDAFCEAMGRPPAYIDGHQHIHVLPQIREILLEDLVRRGWQGKVWLRDSGDSPLAILRRNIELPKAFAVLWFGRGFARAAQDAGFETNSGFSGFSSFDPKCDFAADFARYLRSPGSRHLVMCHPGYSDAELAAVDPNTLSRENELKFLLSPRFEEVLARAGASLKSV
jgi:predicted glycoside hydrolase/deacetylase ChbG (UPF0249 family)